MTSSAASVPASAPAPVKVGFWILLVTLVAVLPLLIVGYISVLNSGTSPSSSLSTRSLMSVLLIVAQIILLFMVRRGIRRARLAVTVLQVAHLVPLFLHPDVFGYVTTGIGLVGVVFLWLPASHAFFTRER